MKRKSLVLSLLLIVGVGCSEKSSNRSTADWAFAFVVWDGFIYRVTDIYLNEIKEEIGVITHFNDLEGTYTGNFSNEYQKGTKLFSIKGIGIDEAIAIKVENGKYRQANRESKYGEK
ncbi:hypothetical protein [Bacillus weihaiensis]|uniref:hypothetical protein n=1 Tax=Bacillus weihaiensis TaxID=1547283 RepID=UPI000933063A|nr:hypothetical protein [Bacillus weihaiensis]